MSPLSTAAEIPVPTGRNCGDSLPNALNPRTQRFSFGPGSAAFLDPRGQSAYSALSKLSPQFTFVHSIVGIAVAVYQMH
jgi:hypothetical protein